MYQREPDLPLPPASTTKIVTAIVVLESEKWGEDLLKVPSLATRVPASKLYLKPGQLMSVPDLLYSLLLSSANDSSLVLAQGIAGSVERFAKMMTRKAHEIGATNSHFTNPHGLTEPGHVSTARDLALLFRYAMKNPTFREIVQTRTSSVKSISTGSRRRTRNITIRNHNRLLWNFDGALGGKTGYTHAAQKCFVGAVSRNGTTLIISILGSRDLWGDTKRLFEYGFDNYESLVTAARPRAVIDGQPVSRQPEPSYSLSPAAEDDKRPSEDGYLVQIAAFREKDRAEILQKLIAETGYETFLEEGPVRDGEITYRVRMGPYPELMRAQEIAREVEDKSGIRAIILPVPAARQPDEKPG